MSGQVARVLRRIADAWRLDRSAVSDAEQQLPPAIPDRPDVGPESYLPQVVALRRAGAIEEADALLERLPGGPGTTPLTALAWAENAQARQDWPEYRRRLVQGRDRFSGISAFWASELVLLQTLSRLEDWEALAADGLRRFPESIEIAAQAASAAAARGNWQLAEARWTAMFDRFPDHPFVQEHRVSITASFRPPAPQGGEGDPVARAAELEATQRWAEAVPLRREVFERLPGNLAAGIGLGQALRESGAFDEADRVLAGAMERYPEDPEVAAQYAQVPVARNDWPEALRRWEAVLPRFPDITALWQMAAVAYRENDRVADAELLLVRAINRHPDRVDLLVEHARLAERRAVWPDAVRRWERVLALRPDDPVLQNCRGEALWHRDAVELEAGLPPDRADAAAPADTTTDDPGKILALQFEGLGDNCEFGVVQRRLGADPLGLLRFAAISPGNLSVLLRERFASLGDPAFLELFALPVGEYMVRDTRGLFHTHTFVRVGSVDERDFLARQVSRLGFLKRKLLEDLDAGSKIFVYKSTHERLDDAGCRDLHRALETYGPNALLVVRVADECQPPGSVCVLEDRLLAGHLDFSSDGTGNVVDFSSWREILVAAHAHLGSLSRSAPTAAVAASA